MSQSYAAMHFFIIGNCKVPEKPSKEDWLNKIQCIYV